MIDRAIIINPTKFTTTRTHLQTKQNAHVRDTYLNWTNIYVDEFAYFGGPVITSST